MIINLSINFILSLIENNGYTAIFILMLLESIILPIPSEVVLPFTGFLISIGKLNFYLGFTDAVIASLLGSIIGYLLGYFLGIDIFIKASKKFGFKGLEYEKGVKWFRRYGDYFAFITKLLPAVRSVASIICGAFEMELKKFIAYSSAGIIIWSGLLIYTGFYLSNNWDKVAAFIQSLGVYVIVLFLAFFLIYIFRKQIISKIKKF